MTARRVLVTGCSSGIGRATALELTARGFDVVASARRIETISDLKVAQTVSLDVDSDADVARARTEVGPVDVLVNNAGWAVDGSVEEVPLSDVRRMFETNFFGAARMIQAFLPAMRERQSGTIVNVTSVAGFVAPPLAGFYAASKFALEALSEALHLEVGHFGVDVVLIEPGAIATKFGENLIDYRGGDGPYAELARLWESAAGIVGGSEPVPGPELVALAICDALASKDHLLRIPVGADAELVDATRRPTTYESFEATMRAVLKLDW
jgi:NAD(P)-dependent dehydrogenase (short-subunit alcohol dehydrogenase family)